MVELLNIVDLIKAGTIIESLSLALDRDDMNKALRHFFTPTLIIDILFIIAITGLIQD